MRINGKTLANLQSIKQKKEADRISYEWDRLIEHFNSHSKPQHEPALRVMAAESSRLARRGLMKAFWEVLIKPMERGQRFLRGCLSEITHNTFYVFLVMPSVEPYDEYSQFRRGFLQACCQVAKLKNPHVTKIIGIASEPASSKYSSQDLCYLNCENWGSVDKEEAEKLQQKLGIWKDSSTQIIILRNSEYPD